MNKEQLVKEITEKSIWLAKECWAEPWVRKIYERVKNEEIFTDDEMYEIAQYKFKKLGFNSKEKQKTRAAKEYTFTSASTEILRKFAQGEIPSIDGEAAIEIARKDSTYYFNQNLKSNVGDIKGYKYA